MAGDEQEEEREFLAELKSRSGRDLAQWMAAITTQGFADKNETIDWLRAQGFPFARASWLERIHKNGGRPIYASGPPRPAAMPVSGPTPGPASGPRPAPPTAATSPAPPAARAPSQRDAAELDRLIAAAKGYRPLYLLLEAEIRNAVPAVGISPGRGYVSFSAPREFAALTLHATALRLGLDLGDRPFEAPLERSRLRGPEAAISHMLVLTDARQVNADLLNLIKAANARVNG